MNKQPKRFKNALAVQQGACNPHAIARTLVEALDEARKEGKSTEIVCLDPAVRLICHQLAFLLRVGEIETGYGIYSALTQQCENEKGFIEQ